MLLRLITIISLFTFMLLMIAGTHLQVALYRSVLVFSALFSLIYLAIFFLNIIRDNSDSNTSTVPEINRSDRQNEKLGN